MTSAQSHITKLDPQVIDYWQDCFDLFAQFVSRAKAEKWAWLVTADAFKGIV
jgi:hypothetical protein